MEYQTNKQTNENGNQMKISPKMKHTEKKTSAMNKPTMRND